MSLKRKNKIASRINLVKDARKKLPILEKIGREIEMHLNRSVKAWIQAFELKYGIHLDIENTVAWQSYKEFMINKQQIQFIRSQLQLFDYLALYSEDYLEYDQSIKDLGDLI